MKTSVGFFCAIGLIGLAACANDLPSGGKGSASDGTEGDDQAQRVSDSTSSDGTNAEPSRDPGGVSSGPQAPAEPDPQNGSPPASSFKVTVDPKITDATVLANATKARNKILDLLAKYDISQFAYKPNKSFVVVEGISFSGERIEDPIQISSDYGLDQVPPESLLLALLHEEFHWSPPTFSPQYEQSLTDFASASWYPTLAKDVGMSNFDTYIHVSVNWYELEAGKLFLPEDKVYEIICTRPYYGPIYDTVVRDEVRIGDYLIKNNLIPSQVVPFVPPTTPKDCTPYQKPRAGAAPAGS